METGLENVPENYKTKKPKDKDHDLLSEEKAKNYQEEISRLSKLRRMLKTCWQNEPTWQTMLWMFKSKA
jgi:hypothetical protein